MNNPTEKPNRSLAFVTYIIEHIKIDKRMKAILKRADNQATEYKSWEYLAAFINLEKDYERLPYATITAAIAKAEVTHNGSWGIGKAIAYCYDDGNKNDQAKAKLRRLLACDSIKEVCRILRPIFSLMRAKGIINLNFANLLQDLLNFNWENSRQRIKSHWAQDFYHRDFKERDEDSEI